MFGFFNNRKSLLESGLLRGAADNHSHILFGVDDGVAKEEESLAILEYLESEGLKTLWLTPHVMDDVPNATDFLRTRFSLLKQAYNGTVDLRLSSENMMDRLYRERLRNRDFLLHSDDRILIETSTWAPPMDFDDLIDLTMKMGYRPILAHPERYTYMEESDYRALHDKGVLFQLNIPSIVGVYGEAVESKALSMLEKGWYSMVGSDCHRLRSIQGQFSSKILKEEVIGKLDSLFHSAEEE
ncbi:MAG: CpsB/CapC family capsule biosynthesis tyrosine phosphatase [Bacteroidales bacterium]